jgi:hypothetical protein
MDNRDRNRSVLEFVNLARSAYGAPGLKTLVSGRPHSASVCAIGRSLRSGVEHWFFVAVGSKCLRLWALGKDSAAIAEQIMTAWGMPRQLLTQPREKLGCVVLAMPAEIREFIDQFDRGLLPDYLGEVDELEMRQLREMVRTMPISVGRRNTWRNSHGKSQALCPATREGPELKTGQTRGRLRSHQTVATIHPDPKVELG